MDTGNADNKMVSSVLSGRGTLLNAFPGTLCRANFQCRSATSIVLPIRNIEEPRFFIEPADRPDISAVSWFWSAAFMPLHRYKQIWRWSGLKSALHRQI